MSTFIEKASNVLSNPQMLAAYTKWASARFFGSEPSVQVPGGGSIAYLRDFTEYWGVETSKPGTAELKMARRALSDGGIALDIGANVGMFAMMFALANVACRVEAFEAAPDVARVLEKNVRRNGLEKQIRVQSKAAADQVGELRFVSAEKGPQTGKIAVGADGKTSGVIVVPCTTIDTHCAAEGIMKVALMKIDVEGAESMVLGAERMLAEHRIDLLYIEWVPEFIQTMGTSTDAQYDLIQGFGYQVHELADDGSAGRMLDKSDMRHFTGDNVLLIPRDAAQ